MRIRFWQPQAHPFAAGRYFSMTRCFVGTLLLLLAYSATQLAAQSGPARDWPAELGAAFEYYYAGDYQETQRACRQIVATSNDPRLRREAAALSALAVMHLPGRAERINGRARLAQLAEDDDSLLTRPECQLAYGIVQSSLDATATAIYHLNQAAKHFAERGQFDRLGETLVALAEAWARHGEWELSIPGLDLPRPENREQADRLRSRQIRGVLTRAQSLSDNQLAARRIELILARHLIDSAEDAGAGVALLNQLSASEPLDVTAAQAALELAGCYEADHRWDAAVTLYTRVGTAGLDDVSEQARQRLQTINRPQLTLTIPERISAGEHVRIELAARNVSAVSFEVRRVDLENWLDGRQGRYSEAALPTSGALLAVRDIQPTVANEYDWWQSETLVEPLSYEAPGGRW